MARHVRPRGHIEERANGTFRAIVHAGIDPLTRKQRYLKKTAPAEAKVRIELTKLQNEVDEQLHPRSSISVRQVIEKWLEVTELEDKTRQRNDGLLRNHIGPTFGDLPASKLDAETLERYYARLRRCSRLCTRPASDHECRPLSASSVRAIRFMSACGAGSRCSVEVPGEAVFAEPPAFERPDPEPPSADEVAALLAEAAKEAWWALLLWLVMVTGCRGEMCVLRWTDVDLTNGMRTSSAATPRQWLDGVRRERKPSSVGES